ncbi:MAG TPA: GNAT family N-acetyltransferase [Myxococcota bacterium]|nr:GNAT family N-acetyltransferase [Myxococcota bacterium]
MLSVEADYHAAGAAESFRRAGALFVRDARTPQIYDANHARLVRTDEARVDELLEAVDAELSARGHRASIRLDPLSVPPSLEARLALDGWECEEGILMTLERGLHRETRELRIRQVESEAEWAAYLSLKLSDDGAAWVRTLGQAWVDCMRRKRPRVRTWLASRGDCPVGFFSEFVEGDLGLLEDLYVHPAARFQGVATTLVAHCVCEARQRGAQTVFLTARAADTPKHMYAKMGFRPVAVTQHWLAPRPRAGES